MANEDMKLEKNVVGTIFPKFSLEEMASVLSNAPAGIGIIKGRAIHWANKTFYEMLGYPMGSLEGKCGSVLYASVQEYDRVGLHLVQAVRSQGSAVIDTSLIRGDGQAFSCRARASMVDPDTPGSGMLLVITDITEIKSLQLQLQQSQKMEAIGVLAGGISHDFNNLLMGIQGHLSLMRINKKAPEKIEGHIGQITKLVNTAADLTGRLLGFARGGKYQINTLDINQVVSSALAMFKPSRKDVLVLEELGKDLPAVDGDHSQLEQVMLNLLINAAQAMADNGTIGVSTRRICVETEHSYPFDVTPGDYVQIRVQDTGVGMDAHIQKKIFDPFFSTKEAGNQKGKGLGLSTVFGIVKNHGGFILVESRPGEGAVFKICLPVSAQAAASREAYDSGDIDEMPRGEETILFVDDEDEVVSLGSKFLKRLGYEALVARNGLEAVELFRLYKDQISLVVLDLIMPVMGGKQAFAELKKIRPDIKVLVSTGYTVDTEVEALLGKGCDGTIQKPFSMHKFSRVLRQILDA